MKAWRLLGQLFSRSGGLSRSMGKTFGGLRDLWSTLGYRDQVDINTYLSFYERGDIAAQIIDLPATATWQYNPEIRLEDDDSEGQGFINDIGALDDRVGLWSKLKELDRLSGIGRFGLLLIGARSDGAQGLDEPLERLQSLKDVLFLKTFHEGAAEVSTWVEDEFDERFGLPLTYKIEFQRGESDKGRTKVVHWSRCLHVAENLVDDDTYGTPRLQRVINKLDDLNKLIGSAAEIFWMAVAGILHADLDPEIDVDPDDMEAFEKDIIEAMQGIRRIIQTRGVTLNRIAANGQVDPSKTYEPLMQLISGTTRIPARILVGSERGELASSQDQRQWNQHIKSRQVNHAEPILVRALFNRFEKLGAFKQPLGWELWWPPLDEPTEAELANIAVQKADAAVKMAPGSQADLLIKPWEAREILGLPPVPEEPPEGAVEAFAEGLDPDEEAV